MPLSRLSASSEKFSTHNNPGIFNLGIFNRNSSIRNSTNISAVFPEVIQSENIDASRIVQHMNRALNPHRKSNTRLCNCTENDVTNQYNNHGANVQTIYTRLLRFCGGLSFIPVVHAETASLEDSGRTTMDQLQYGKPNHSKYHVEREEIEDFIAAQSGLDRIRLIFTGIDTPYGKMRHPEVSFFTSVMKCVVTCMFVGGSAYSVYSAKQAVRDTPLSQFDVKQAATLRSPKVNDVFFSGIRWSLRGALGATVLLGTMLGISTYRNKSGVVEVSIASALMTGLAGLAQGPRAGLNYAVFGLFTGTVAGGLLLLVRRQTGSTQEEHNYWISQHYLACQKNKKFVYEESP